MSESKQLKQSNGGGHRTPDSHPDPDPSPSPTRATATEGSELALRPKNHGPSIAYEDTRWLERKDLQLVKRDDVKKHSHKNVWTKDPHGGRYRLCTGPDAAKGYDALEERPDGTKVNTDPGYEKPQLGPTSNFVGNHMTQGAIDLVQRSLTRKDRNHELAKLKRYQCTYHPPKLVGRVTGDPTRSGNDMGQEPRRRRFEKYSWWDDGAKVVIEAPHGFGGNVKLKNSFHSTGFAIEAESTCGGAVLKDLAISRLFRPIVPEESTCVSTSKGEGVVVIRLQKEDRGCEWTQLCQPDEDIRRLPPASPNQTKAEPDLALLRKAIRQQRKNKKAGDGLLYTDLAALTSAKHKEGDNEGDDDMVDAETEAAAKGKTAEEIESMALESMEMGSYDSAAKFYTYVLNTMDAAKFEARAKLLLKRSGCFSQIGDIKKAIRDVEDCRAMQIRDLEEETLLSLAKLYEQIEDYEKGMQCLQNLGQLNSKHPSLPMLRSRIRQGRMMIQKERDAHCCTGGTVLPSIPRKVLPQFEHRGKSGAVF